MRIGMRTGVAMLALAAGLAACNRGGGGAGGGGGGAEPGRKSAQARADSVRNEAKMLRDSGVTVDTQTVDTGGAAPQQTEDN